MSVSVLNSREKVEFSVVIGAHLLLKMYRAIAL